MIKLSLIFIALLTFNLASAQDVQSSRRISQKVTTTHALGSTDITIVYHSPSANGRKIFGGIVPYDFVVEGKEYPWRAGSNNRTTIEFSHDVWINGNPLPAGIYGLLVLVSENEWTFIFSSNLSWGAFQYTPENDILRITSLVYKRPFQEWLSYDYVNPMAEKLGVELHWTDVAASFEISTNVSANIISDINKKDDKTSDDFLNLATESYKLNPKQYERSLAYIDSGLAIIDKVEERLKSYLLFSLNILKADILIENGDEKEGEKLKSETIKSATNFSMYYYGLYTLTIKKDKKEALRLLSEDIKAHPTQWATYLALGEYYIKDGNQEKVVENFKKAYENAPDNWKHYARYLYLQNKLILK